MRSALLVPGSTNKVKGKGLRPREESLVKLSLGARLGTPTLTQPNPWDRVTIGRWERAVLGRVEHQTDELRRRTWMETPPPSLRVQGPRPREWSASIPPFLHTSRVRA
jgi:hypothetical protein